MKKLIIYDNAGCIYMQMSGTYTLPQGGIQYLETEIQEGKIATKVDTTVTPHVAVFEDIPKTDIEIANEEIAELKAQAAETEYALMMGGLI